MEKKRKRKRVVLFLCSIFGLYCVISIGFSMKLGKLRSASDSSMGKENVYADVISDKNFEKLSHRRDFSLAKAERPNLTEELKQTPIFTVFWFGGVKSVYKYSYEIADEVDIYSGSWRIPMTTTWDFIDGNWKIIDVHEAV